jgi:hypothetical protein
MSERQIYELIEAGQIAVVGKTLIMRGLGGMIDNEDNAPSNNKPA